MGYLRSNCPQQLQIRSSSKNRISIEALYKIEPILVSVDCLVHINMILVEVCGEAEQ